MISKKAGKFERDRPDFLLGREHNWRKEKSRGRNLKIQQLISNISGKPLKNPRQNPRKMTIFG